MSGRRQRVAAVDDRTMEWLEKALADGMSGAEATRVLCAVWIPRLVAAIVADDEAEGGAG